MQKKKKTRDIFKTYQNEILSPPKTREGSEQETEPDSTHQTPLPAEKLEGPPEPQPFTDAPVLDQFSEAGSIATPHRRSRIDRGKYLDGIKSGRSSER